MSLNRQRGNMYDWITHTLTCLEGACSHGCSYCYVKALMRYPVLAKKYSGKPRLVENDMERPLGKNRVIFVCSTTDLFARNVPEELTKRVLRHCAKYPENEYLFQTKNPLRFHAHTFRFPEKTTLGVTLETNRVYDVSKAPVPYEIYRCFHAMGEYRHKRMISIEPVMDFDLAVFLGWIRSIAPDFVSIGADSKRHGLVEPSSEKLVSLIRAMKTFTEVKVKKNLGRLL